MKKIKKSVLKENYYYECKPFYDALPEKLTVPSYQTEIFTETLSHKEILEKYRIEPYNNIQDAFAVAADCIPTLKNDYNGRLTYFMDGDTRCRLRVYRDSDGELRVYILGVDPDNQWGAGYGVLYSAETSIPLKVDTLKLCDLDPLSEQKVINMLKLKGYKITKEKIIIEEF